MNTSNLNLIREQLAQFEDSIIYTLLNRSKYPLNPGAYLNLDDLAEKSKFDGKSQLEFMLFNDEKFKSTLGKFQSPQEKAFFFNQSKFDNSKKNLSIIPDSLINKINLTNNILESYSNLLKNISFGDDGNYGTSCEADILALQTLSSRIHFGTFYISEAKFLENENFYSKLALKNDSNGILRELTNLEVENNIYNRVIEKVENAQRFYTNSVFSNENKINPKIIGNFFREVVFPLTKTGEVKYLMLRGKMN